MNLRTIFVGMASPVDVATSVVENLGGAFEKPTEIVTPCQVFKNVREGLRYNENCTCVRGRASSAAGTRLLDSHPTGGHSHWD